METLTAVSEIGQGYPGSETYRVDVEEVSAMFGAGERPSSCKRASFLHSSSRTGLWA